MRILGGIVVFLLLGAVLWRPHSRSAPVCLSLTLIVLCMLVLAGCGPPSSPTETFEGRACTYRDTGEWRTRRERGDCISRTPKHTVNGHTTGGSCIAWSQNTIREKMQSVSCSKDRWVRR